MPNNFEALTEDEMKEYLASVPEGKVPTFYMPFEKLKKTKESVGNKLFQQFLHKSVIQTTKEGYDFLYSEISNAAK